MSSANAGNPLHLVSAWASTQRLVLAQEPVDAKENECAAILEILKRLSIKGALITIDAIATNPDIASAITHAGGDYLSALKANQPTFYAEVSQYFDDAPSSEVRTVTSIDKDRGRIETRIWRLTSLSLVIWPSVWPLDRSTLLRQNSTATSAAPIPKAKDKA